MSDSQGSEPAASWSLSGTVRLFFKQLREYAGVLALVYGTGIVLLACVWVAGTRPDSAFKIGDLLRDANSVADVPFYVGAMSNLGILLWAAAAGIALFTYAVVKKNPGLDREWKHFFLMIGALTTVLVLDDAFMLHEEAFPDYFFPESDSFFRMREGWFYITYALFSIALLWRCRRVIFQGRNLAFLLLAFGFLGLSVAADKAGLKRIIPMKQARLFVEDGFKFLGILGWLLSIVRFAMDVLTAKVPTNRS